MAPRAPVQPNVGVNRSSTRRVRLIMKQEIIWIRRPDAIKGSASKATPLKQGNLNLADARPAYVTPKAGPSTLKAKTSQTSLKAFFDEGKTTPASVAKPQKIKKAPSKPRHAGPNMSTKANSEPSKQSRRAQSNLATWDSDDELKEVQDLEPLRPAKRLRLDPPVIYSPRHTLSTHEAVLQAGMRRSPSPLSHSVPEAPPDDCLPNPFEGEVFSQLPFDEQTVDMALWRRLADLDELPPPPRSPPPKPQRRKQLKPLTSPPKRDAPPVSPPKSVSSSQTVYSQDGQPGDSQRAVAGSMRSNVVHEHPFELLFPDDRERVQEVSKQIIAGDSVTRAVTPGGDANAEVKRSQVLRQMHCAAEKQADIATCPSPSETLVQTQLEDTTFQFAVLPNSSPNKDMDPPMASHPETDVGGSLSWELADADADDHVLAPETYVPNRTGRESERWAQLHTSFGSLDPASVPDGNELHQSRLSTYFKPDVYTKEQRAAIVAVILARHRDDTPQLIKSSAEPSTVIAERFIDSADGLEDASSPIRDQEAADAQGDTICECSVASSQELSDLDSEVHHADFIDLEDPSQGAWSIDTNLIYETKGAFRGSMEELTQFADFFERLG